MEDEGFKYPRPVVYIEGTTPTTGGKNMMKYTEEKLKTLQDAQHIVEDARMAHLFGDQPTSFMLQSISEGLQVVIRDILHKKYNKEMKE